jgi:hypothetical protein
MPHATLAPLGCIDQETINERGEHTSKFRMTHDQSFPGPSGHSVNERVIKEALPNCMYSRMLHYIISIRSRYHSGKIFISKFDLDSPYCRAHLSGSTALESLTIHEEALLIAHWMTFGGSLCPSLWGYISETLADTCNTLIQCTSWDHFSF